ncbi:fatty acid elongase [Macrophomina phaseolina]|uniref:Elongation of fatty acids protein n=1 Tax=Macrophomina phaseolina TaxID=35725 RepID=A0ABQ8FVH1_9PEZI|nr:fatty acid elongase [Macrophomina phaseolina]KAH7029951.1 fatty acid elongase [Macrophomina phaseolina]
MLGPSFHLECPSREFFKFPPDWAPPALPPPQFTGTLRAPFSINAETYNALLSPKVPATIATIYAIAVTLLNRYNKSRGNKPWTISRTKGFFAFVILHNVFLAVYSGITNVAMARALYRMSPGLNAGLVENVDALCKIHGLRGLGNSVSFNNTGDGWNVKNSQILLGANGELDPTDVGRLWNEGLAFWGWWFYLSKFYEVLDTAIILAKGKRSSTLQTYHHAGAMLCMWAGIRFMSPPIWVFVFINSGIHALMYTYYTVSALGVRVPQPIKRSLTTMQIAQFIVGANFAAAHLFVSYTVPVSTPYILVQTVSSAAASAASAVSSSATAAASATSATGLGGVIKKLLFRAAGEEGLAENVRDDSGNVFGPEAANTVEIRDEIRWRDEYIRVPCISTTGQSFAIWLNVIYLMPLTALFVRFFVRSYIKNTSQASKGHATSKAAKDATHGIEREMTATNGSANGKPHQNGSVNKQTEKQTEKQVNAHEDRPANGGLSTINPNKADKSYAEMAKH